MSAEPPELRDLPDGFGDQFELGGGFVDQLGLVLDLVSPTRVEAHIDLGDQHHQPYGIVHGGVHASIVETLGSVGAAANVAGKLGTDHGVVGVVNQTDFLRAMRGGRANAVATPVHAGRTQQLWQVVITDVQADKVAARGQLRLQVISMAQGSL